MHGGAGFVFSKALLQSTDFGACSEHIDGDIPPDVACNYCFHKHSHGSEKLYFEPHDALFNAFSTAVADNSYMQPAWFTLTQAHAEVDLLTAITFNDENGKMESLLQQRPI